MTHSRPGKVLVRPNSDPKSAFERELDSALAAGDERVAYGICIGLALVTCETMEVLWAKAQERQTLGELL